HALCAARGPARATPAANPRRRLTPRSTARPAVEHDDYMITPEPSLYDWAGGSDAFRWLIDAFYDRVERDDLLSPLFPGGVSEEHRRNVATWWSEGVGGPADYTGKLGGYERMLDKHRQLGITKEQRFRFASLM